MKKYLLRIVLISGIAMFTGKVMANISKIGTMMTQNDLLSEYEQKLILIEKQFADFKKQIDPKNMSKLDVKMKVGSFENNRNSLKARMKELRASKAPLSETDKGDLDKKFEKLTVDFEALKTLAH